MTTIASRNAKFDLEVQNVVRKIGRLKNALASKEMENVIDNAGDVLVQVAQAQAPDSKEVHHRYSTAKAYGKLKAPKGAGSIAASYYPGNIKRSIQKLTHISSPLNLVIGLKRFKGRSPSGKFAGKRVDPFYALMVHDGTENQAANPFMERAVTLAKPQIKLILLKGSKGILERHSKRVR